VLNKQVVIIYNNINFKDKKCDQVTGHTDTMRLMTTAAIILCPRLPLSGLRYFIYNPTIPLRLKDILAAPSISSEDGEIGLSII